MINHIGTPKPIFQQGIARSPGESKYPQLWNGLIGLWSPMTGRQGLTTLLDFSNNKQHGTLNGSMDNADWVMTQKGFALDFDGSNDYVGIGSSAVHSPTYLTAMAWVYTGSAASQVILYKGSAATNSWFFRLQLGVNVRFGVTTAGGATNLTTTSNPVIANRWNHIAVKYDGANMYIFVNGKQEATGAKTGTFSNTTLESRIGITTDNLLPMVGRIAELRMYGRVLNKNEIIQSYLGASPLQLRDFVLGKASAAVAASTFLSKVAFI